MKSILLPLVLVILAASCATNTGDPVKDARGRATNQALAEAGKVLGKVVVAGLMNAAQQEMSGGKVDFGHAATQGLFSTAPTIFSSDQVDRVVQAYAGDKLPTTAKAAAKAFKAAPPSVTDEAKTNAIAQVISTAAGKPITNLAVVVNP